MYSVLISFGLNIYPDRCCFGWNIMKWLLPVWVEWTVVSDSSWPKSNLFHEVLFPSRAAVTRKNVPATPIKAYLHKWNKLRIYGHWIDIWSVETLFNFLWVSIHYPAPELNICSRWLTKSSACACGVNLPGGGALKMRTNSASMGVSTHKKKKINVNLYSSQEHNNACY